ncbi:MAG TPA: S9 family peptidase [Candidatus Polarisedimenticolia bacterium]|nr:S9 family peptidase [Candidatus Polarisedimenticolia bacterium]
MTMRLVALPPAAFALLCVALPPCAVAETAAPAAGTLTLDRIFAAPDIAGPAPSNIELAPDGSRVTFLRGKATNKDQLDLWEFNVKAGETRLLVDSDRLQPERVELSDEEKARRERQRIAGTTGIVEYHWSPTGRSLLFPLGGDIYVYDLGGKGEEAARRITTTEAFETDARFSPDGRFISFIRDQDLFVFDLRGGSERQLTADGDGVIKNGMAEFVAQEEMRRFTGYWWSPDEKRIAFTRVDESPIALTSRFEIYAEEVKLIEQRYPYAGTDNALVELRVVEVASGEQRSVRIDGARGDYIYRVAWFPDGEHLAVQRQPRDLQSLDLLKCGVRDGTCLRLLRETSDIWIELQDDLTFLQGSREFVWSSRRSGYQHLYLYDLSGREIRRLTDGEWEVVGSRRGNGVLGVDEKRRVVLFMATAESPLERHLYEQSLDTGDPKQVKRITEPMGVHDVDLSEDASLYVDTFSSPSQPPQVSVHRSDGRRLAWLEENRLDSGHPYHPYLSAHIEPEFGAIEATDGQQMFYRLYKPAHFDAQKRYPAVVYVYGGPTGQTVTRSWGRTTEMWLQLMAQRGYAVFTVDNRGTGFRGAAFDAPIYRRLGKIEVEDQIAGLDFLQRLEWIDDDRIGVFGWSYGGYMTLMMMMQAPGRFAAGVSGAPVTDWRLYDTYYTERFLGHPDENGEGYEMSGVFPFAGRLEDDLLIIHGMADDNVLFTNSTKLFKDLQDKGKPFEMMTYPGAKHSLTRIAGTGPHCLGIITRFFDRELRP